MGLPELADHLLNFLAPAIGVGCLLAWVAPWFFKKKASAGARLGQALINCCAGALALALGLWFFGHDGKMASYAALVLACATSQWLAQRR